MATAATYDKLTRWGRQDALDYLSKRRIASNCPLLRSYLYSGARVLDVGCGPGAITLEVAGLVHPGAVTGVDLREESIAFACSQVDAAQAANVTFQVGDAQNLDFPDNKFDLTYSLNTTDYLPDPVAALREYRRVTAPGGWVVSTLAHSEIIIYPDFPTLTRCIQTMRNPPEKSLGKRWLALFSEAGFSEIRVEMYSPPEMCVYPGAPFFESLYNIQRHLMEPEGFNRVTIQERIAAGAIMLKEVYQAQQELDAWYRHPHAFYSAPIFLASGRVP
ncbi:MAG: methyltransferase domain-containing protein [Chloroflexi bacterium]|nr:methyltransferase domain-containing protein [Chloroflexota bacterium]